MTLQACLASEHPSAGPRFVFSGRFCFLQAPDQKKRDILRPCGWFLTGLLLVWDFADRSSAFSYGYEHQTLEPKLQIEPGHSHGHLEGPQG